MKSLNLGKTDLIHSVGLDIFGRPEAMLRVEAKRNINFTITRISQIPLKWFGHIYGKSLNYETSRVLPNNQWLLYFFAPVM